MLTISRLTRWSINYYNDTAHQASQAGLDRQRANGGLGEYYSEGDTRAPSWLITSTLDIPESITGTLVLRTYSDYLVRRVRIDFTVWVWDNRVCELLRWDCAMVTGRRWCR